MADDDPSSSSLATDLEQYELMQTAYTGVGVDFKEKEELFGPEYHKLLRVEAVPRRWPLARLSIPLQKIVDRLDRVLAGCCWEAFATRAVPEESLPAIKQASKRLTMLLAGYLAKEVAAILRGVLTHPTKRLYDDNTVHLLCSNYWLQPIYQELLHSSSRYNATVTSEKNRPCSGLARVSAHPRPSKIRKPSATATRFIDWIGGMCYADTLQDWFPAHWPPLSFVSSKGRRMNTGVSIPPGWMDIQVECNSYAYLHSRSRLDSTPRGKLLRYVPYFETRCCCRGVQNQRCLSLGDYQSGEATSFPVSAQSTAYG